MAEPCDTLFETLLSMIDKPYDYNHLLAKLLCRLLQITQAQLIEHIDGVPMIGDPDRNKTLSIARPIIIAGDFGHGVTNRYLSIEDVPTSGPSGFLVPRAATITGLWAKSRSTGNWTLEVRKNGVQLSVANLTIAAGGSENDFVDIDVDEGDVLQIYAAGTGIQFPLAKVELAWRKT